MTKTIKDNKADGVDQRPKNRKSQAAAKVARLEKQVKQLKQENEELRDRLLRNAAEFDNYRKRKDNEFLQLISDANADLLFALLPVVDDLERSLGSLEDSGDSDSVKRGVELICANLKKVMERFGLKTIEAVGQPFDPDKHDALIQVESEEYPSGIVVDEHLKGYVLNDRVLRHSQVLVSK